ncbi:MAG: DUF4168 domain-containing protein [Aquamicrobium sp.]|uniref:DUF4168 domain-containing protein n=1 Tax=Aquamicrobium sp. TaxID=1872579 RepID=UPI00349E55E9|nr:DUF4168 domain-containing protein [Aquamicrobium sp.]
MTLNKILLSGLSALAIGLGASLGAASAQDAAPAPAPAPQTEEAPAAAPQQDDAKLKSFAVAFIEVAKVTQSYQPQIESAGTAEDQSRLRQEAGEKMVEAVNEAEGITLDEYNTIIQAAQTDPDLAQKINGHIAEAVGERQEPVQEPAQQPAPQ